MYRDFIYEKQNPENGLWEDGVYYASVNGLMKILASFQSLGIKLNYADKAFESAMTMAKHTGRDAEGPTALLDSVLGSLEREEGAPAYEVMEEMKEQ